jgi:hypothetical protein
VEDIPPSASEGYISPLHILLCITARPSGDTLVPWGARALKFSNHPQIGLFYGVSFRKAKPDVTSMAAAL